MLQWTSFFFLVSLQSTSFDPSMCMRGTGKKYKPSVHTHVSMVVQVSCSTREYLIQSKSNHLTPHCACAASERHMHECTHEQLLPISLGEIVKAMC